VGPTDTAALSPCKKRTSKRKVFYNFWKIIKTVATRCHILKLKCTKFDFGSADPVARFNGPTSKGKEGRGREGKERA